MNRQAPDPPQSLRTGAVAGRCYHGAIMMRSTPMRWLSLAILGLALGGCAEQPGKKKDDGKDAKKDGKAKAEAKGDKADEKADAKTDEKADDKPDGKEAPVE